MSQVDLNFNYYFQTCKLRDFVKKILPFLEKCTIKMYILREGNKI